MGKAVRQTLKVCHDDDCTEYKIVFEDAVKII
jgi:hypothetical protein